MPCKDEKAWRAARVARGLCEKCGKERLDVKGKLAKGRRCYACRSKDRLCYESGIGLAEVQRKRDSWL